LKDDKRILPYQLEKCSPGTPHSGNIRFMQIFAGIPWQGSLKQVWWSERAIFRNSGRHIFGTFWVEANIIMQRHEVPYRLSNYPRNARPWWSRDAILC